MSKAGRESARQLYWTLGDNGDQLLDALVKVKEDIDAFPHRDTEDAIILSAADRAIPAIAILMEYQRVHPRN